MAIKQTWRGFVSLTILLSAIISAFTGIVLYFVPQGRVARWILWDFLGMGKDAWGGIHTLSSYLFLIFFVFHVLNNLTSIKNYLVKKSGGINQGPQLLAAIIISVVIFVSGAFSLYPLHYVMEFGEYLKGMAVSSPDDEPPFGHAEEVPLASFCRKMDIDVSKAMTLLRENGIKIENKEKTLAEVAIENKTSPLDIYLMIKELEVLPVVTPVSDASGNSEASDEEVWTVEKVEKVFNQAGQGRKTVEDVAKQLNIPVEKALKRLAAKGIEAKASDTLKDLKGILPDAAMATDVIALMAIPAENEK